MCKDAHSISFLTVLRNGRFQGAREETAVLRKEEMLATTAASGVLEHAARKERNLVCGCVKLLYCMQVCKKILRFSENEKNVWTCGSLVEPR